MADELDLLKRDWRKKGETMPKLSYDDLYRMLWKRSSSIVRWILVISILEFILPQFLYMLPSFREQLKIENIMGIHDIMLVLTIVSYAVALYFIVQFYFRYRDISVLDNAHGLMQKIIRTRSVVKQYIVFSLSMVMVSIGITISAIYRLDDVKALALAWSLDYDALGPQNVKAVAIAAYAITGILITVLLGGIYFLIYGSLLHKLKRNLRDLESMGK